jgi:hypothetical protein
MIVMTLIVRDEADIVGENIAHHLALGVDRIIVTDNGSTDGTKDILSDLARGGAVAVAHEDGPFRQVEAAHAMVEEARDRYRAAWVSAFDADEFVVPPDGETLAAHLGRQAGRVVIVPRVNVFPTRETLATWDWRAGPGWRNAWPEGPPPRMDVPARAMAWPYMAYATFPKVMFRPEGFVQMVKGGHAVTLDPPAEGGASGLTLWHFPLRAVARLEQAIARRRPVLAADPNPAVSGQYRRWIRMLDKGLGMEAVLDEILPSQGRVQDLVAAGAIAPVVHPVVVRPRA